MRRFVLLWAVLGAVVWMAGTAVDFAGFRRFDWTFEAFCEDLLVPAAQAAAVAALLRRRPSAAGSTWNRVPVPARLLLAADGALAVVSLLVPPDSTLAAGRPSSVVATATALQASAAGLLALGLAAAAKAPGADRGAWALAGGVGLAAAAASGRSVPHRVAAALLPRAAAIVRLSVLGLGAFLAAVAILLVAGKALGRRCPAAGMLLDAASAGVLASGTIAALHFFRFPRVHPPWDGVVRAVLLASAGLALSAFLAAARSPGGDAR